MQQSNSPVDAQTPKLTIDTQPLNEQQYYAPSLMQNNASPVRRRQNYAVQPESGPYFTTTKMVEDVITVSGQSVQYNILARIDKGFFMHDNDFTCYRRNYFQLSAAFNASMNDQALNVDKEPCVVRVNGQMQQIRGYKICIASRVAASQKEIGLVQHTSKRDKGPQMLPTPRSLVAGGNLTQSQLQQLLTASPGNINETNYPGVVTFERVQFKSATANNGKRRAAQQYYVLDVHLYAELTNNMLIKIATAVSAPLVVRGRSPGHYHDTPSVGGGHPMSAGLVSPYPQQHRLASAPLPQNNHNLLALSPHQSYAMNMDQYNLFSPLSAHMEQQMFSPAVKDDASLMKGDVMLAGEDAYLGNFQF